MAKRSQILETVLSVVDRATATITKVEKEARGLEGVKPEVTVTADDRASDPLADIRQKLDRLDGDEAEALLKVEKTKAERDVRAIRKELLAVDDEQVEAEIRADKDQAQRRVDEIKSELEKLDRTKVEPKIEVDGADGAGGKAGGLFSGGFSKALGAGAIGTALVSAFNVGMDRLQLGTRFRQQFGLVKADADRLGKEAADLYADGWGESLGDVQGALGLVQQRLVQTKQVAADEADDIAEAALAMADVFGVDVAEVIRSVSQLMLNGLAPDADAAMDQLVAAMQDGGNAAGDLFDSVDEYSQHFAGFGLSAEDMMAMFVTGMQNGQRDTDKLGDAVKEMRIRTVEDTDAISSAYADLGLDADEYRDKITEGGDTARTAFLDIITAIRGVEDPVERNRIAIELLGTQYEDMGPKALDALAAVEQGTRDVSTATEDLVDDVDETTSELDKLWRNASGTVGEAAESMAGAINDLLDPTTDDFIDKMKDVGFASSDASDDMLEYGSSTDRLKGSVGETTPFLQEMERRTALVDAALQDANTSTSNLESSTDDAADATDGFTDEIVELEDAFADLRGEMSDRSAYLDVQDSFDSLKEKGQEAWDAAATGADKAEESARDFERAQISLKNEVIGYAEEIGNIPASKVSDIIALIDQGKLDEAQEKLNSLERARTASVSVNLTKGSGWGNAMSQVIAMDSGGTVRAGDTAVVAERRPEFVNGVLVTQPTLVSGPAQVTGGAASADMLRRPVAGSVGSSMVSGAGSGGGVTLSFDGANFYGSMLPQETMNQILAAVQRAERLNR